MAKYTKKDKNSSVNENLPVMMGQMPPNAYEFEVAVLGALMLDRLAVSKVLEILTAESFYNSKNRAIFEAIIRLNEKGLIADILSLSEELKVAGQLEAVGGIPYLAEISQQIPTSVLVEQHAKIVQEKFLKRSLIQVAGLILANAYDDSKDALEEIDNAEREIFKIAEKRLKKSIASFKSLSIEAYQLINSLSKRDNSGYTGVPSGLIELDKYLGGFQKSDLIILAARPSMGKTALALSMARNAAVHFNAPVAFFSIEMSAIQLVIRLISSEAMVDQQKIRTGRISHEDENSIVDAFGRLGDSPIFIDDTPNLSIMEIRAKCRRLKAEHDIQIVFIDYLQLISSPRAESREREISIISANLKQIAKELDIPIVALAQLNRSVESRTDKRPMLSDLRESGSIEQDADVVLFVNRPEYYGIMTYDDDNKTPTAGTAEIIIGKQRNGPTATSRVAFQKNYARFENLSNLIEQPDASDYIDHDDFDDEEHEPF